MARGSIVWRCQDCGTKTKGTCRHPGASYSIIYPLQRWDVEQGRVVKGQKWEKVKGPNGKKANKKGAEVALSDRLKAVHEGSFRDLQEITFPDFADKWMKEYVQGGVKRSTW